jgi:hypothetical protein
LLQGCELGYALFSKAVAQSEGKFFKRHHKKRILGTKVGT